jgi:N-methylhydantoinase A/oxoprolinase/acetone carboxylase beta subunit
MWRDEPVDTPVFTLPLALDTRVTGPAVLEMEDSSVLVPPGWSLGADRSGGLELTQQGES